MLTEQQIQDQQNYERKQIQGGLHKLRTNTTKLEEKTYASATVYGSACVSSILPDLIAFIDSKKEKISFQLKSKALVAQDILNEILKRTHA